MKIRKNIYYIMILTVLAGIHNGRIALWYGEDPEPKFVLPYSADLLPEKDRLALERGIRIENQEELTRFLEDFCS